VINDIVTILSNQIPLLTKAAVSLPIAAILGAVLAFRPRHAAARFGGHPHADYSCRRWCSLDARHR